MAEKKKTSPSTVSAAAVPSTSSVPGSVPTPRTPISALPRIPKLSAAAKAAKGSSTVEKSGVSSRETPQKKRPAPDGGKGKEKEKEKEKKRRKKEKKRSPAGDVHPPTPPLTLEPSRGLDEPPYGSDDGIEDAPQQHLGSPVEPPTLVEESHRPSSSRRSADLQQRSSREVSASPRLRSIPARSRSRSSEQPVRSPPPRGIPEEQPRSSTSRYTSASYVARYARESEWRERPASYRSHSPSYRDRYHRDPRGWETFRRSRSPHRRRGSRSRSPAREDPRYLRRRSRSPSDRRRSFSRSPSTRYHRAREPSPRYRAISPPPRVTATATRPVESVVTRQATVTTACQTTPVTTKKVKSVVATPNRGTVTVAAPVVEKPQKAKPVAAAKESDTERRENSPTSDSYESSAESEASEVASQESPPLGFGDPVPDSAPEDVHQFSAMLLRMASTLGLNIVEAEPEDDDPVFSVFEGKPPATAPLPLLPRVSRIVKTAWERPASAQPIPHRLEHLYRVQRDNAGYLFNHPVPNSVVVESAQTKGSGRLHTTPPDKEGKKLDAYARRFYSAASLHIRLSNTQACLAAYLKKVLDRLQPALDAVPDDIRPATSVIFNEAIAIARQQMASSRHAVEIASRVMAGSVGLRRHAWLRPADIQEETRRRIEDLPFDGEGLFNSATDQSLDTLVKARLTAKKIGLQPTAQSRRPPAFRQQWRRSSTSSFHRSAQSGQSRQSSGSSTRRPFRRRPSSSKKSSSGAKSRF